MRWIKITTVLFFVAISYKSFSQKNIFDLFSLRQFSLERMYDYCHQNGYRYVGPYKSGIAWDKYQQQDPLFQSLYLKYDKVKNENYLAYITNDYPFYQDFIENYPAITDFVKIQERVDSDGLVQFFYSSENKILLNIVIQRMENRGTCYCFHLSKKIENEFYKRPTHKQRKRQE